MSKVIYCGFSLWFGGAFLDTTVVYEAVAYISLCILSYNNKLKNGIKNYHL